MKRIFFAILFFFSMAVLPRPAFAQGEYWCTPNGNPNANCIVGPGGDRCEQGYMPGSECSKLKNLECVNKKFTCIRNPEEEVAPNTTEAVSCDTGSGKGLDTAIGCIPIEDPNAFLGFILKWAIGVGGGIAFLLVGFSSFMIMTSSGNPDRLKAGQELLTSALMGVVLLVFSVFILKVIGVDILYKNKDWGQFDLS